MEHNRQHGNLHGKRALITGGTKGIGKAIADKLAQEGAEVIVSARNLPSDAASEHHFIAADLTIPESIAALTRQIGERFGGIDILINNAGGLTTRPRGATAP